MGGSRFVRCRALYQDRYVNGGPWAQRAPRAHGPHWPHGPNGPNGPHGAHGPLGPHGPMGPLGPMGPRGPRGPMGPLGGPVRVYKRIRGPENIDVPSQSFINLRGL